MTAVGQGGRLIRLIVGPNVSKFSMKTQKPERENREPGPTPKNSVRNGLKFKVTGKKNQILNENLNQSLRATLTHQGVSVT